MRRLVAWVPLLLAACALAPADPYERAQHELARSRLLRALEALDTVPVSHARYPDARQAAVDVEGRVRRCHELVLEALRLRSEWRDLEALERLRRAQEQWPAAPSLARWIRVTEQRIATLGAAAPVQGESRASRAEVETAAAAPSVDVPPFASAPSLPTAPAPMAELSPSPALPPAGSDAADPAGPAAATVAPPSPPEAAAPNPPESPKAAEPARPAPRALPPGLPAAEVAAELASVERLLRQGERRRALASLDALARACPADDDVARRLVTLLRQRALLSYGSGRLDDALSDWRRILEVEPDNEEARALAARAAAERAGTRRR